MSQSRGEKNNKIEKKNFQQKNTNNKIIKETKIIENLMRVGLSHFPFIVLFHCLFFSFFFFIDKVVIVFCFFFLWFLLLKTKNFLSNLKSLFSLKEKI